MKGLPWKGIGGTHTKRGFQEVVRGVSRSLVGALKYISVAVG